MRKYLIVLGIVFASIDLYAQNAEAGNEENGNKFTLIAKGEVGASVRNYTGNRFATDKGVDDENSVAGSVPGIGFCAEYKIAPKWKANCNVEYISGSGIKLDNFSITHSFNPALNVTAGMFELPIGHCNTNYAYIDYFHTGDPEGEYALIACPMTEMGVSLNGTLECGLSYHASITTGLNAAKFTAPYWVGSSSQAFNYDESNFSSPAYAIRLGYNGIKHFQMGAGFYYSSNTVHNSSFYSAYKEYCKNKFGSLKKTPVTIWYADAEYANDFVTIRGSYMQGDLGNPAYLTDYYNHLINSGDDKDIDYKFGTIGKGAIAVMGEIGLNLKNCFYAESKGPELYPFVHYEYYDSQHKADDVAGIERDPRGKVNMWSFGLNWKPIKEVAVKCNYTTRKTGNGGMNPANEVNVALAYNFNIF